MIACGAPMTLVPDFDPFSVAPPRPAHRPTARHRAAPLFWPAKSCIDVVGTLALLPLIALLAGVLLALNPVLNPGPLLFRQRRMGRDGVHFTIYKFRTMAHGSRTRAPDQPPEAERLAPFGRWLRRTGLDELPQALNILRGEMSLIGPRPDCATHAETFLDTIPEYRHRLRVKPGISGYAQVTLGYAVGATATRAKAQADLDYIARAGFGLDLWITWRTLVTILSAGGD